MPTLVALVKEFWSGTTLKNLNLKEEYDTEKRQANHPKKINIKRVFTKLRKMAKNDFSVLSNKRCLDCNQPLKANLLEKNPEAERCHVCSKLRSNSENYNRGRYLEKQRKLRIAHNWQSNQ